MRRSVLRCSTDSCPAPLHSGASGLPSRRCRRCASGLSCDTLQFAAEIEAWSVLCWLCFLLPARFCFWRLGRHGIGKTGQVLLQLLVALSDPPLVGVIHLNFLP